MKRRVLIAGGSGLVGNHILQKLLADESVSEVHVIGRRPISVTNEKIQMHVEDVRFIVSAPTVDEVYLALGTTLRAAGSKEAFREIDYQANLAIARAASAAGARRFGLVSSIGANARSSAFYARTKGELEDAVTQLRAEGIVIARPSLLLGDRKSLGQPNRVAEHLAAFILKAMHPLIPKEYRPVAAAKVARALLQCVPSAGGIRIISSSAIQHY